MQFEIVECPYNDSQNVIVCRYDSYVIHCNVEPVEFSQVFTKALSMQESMLNYLKL